MCLPCFQQVGSGRACNCRAEQLRPAANPRFWHGLEVTAWFAIGGVAIQLVLGFIMALALQAVSAKLRRAVTTLFLCRS